MLLGPSTARRHGDIMKALPCILLAFVLAGNCWAGQIFRGSTTGGGGSTTWGPTSITAAENDALSATSPPLYNDCLDTDGGAYGGLTAGSIYAGGFRWETSIPEGATITAVSLRIYVAYPPSPANGATIYLHDTASSSDFAATGIIADRTRTTASYSTGTFSNGWNTFSGAGLISAVQEVVDLSGFGGTLSFLLIPTAADMTTQIHSYATNCGSNYATLEVTYE